MDAHTHSSGFALADPPSIISIVVFQWVVAPRQGPLFQGFTVGVGDSMRYKKGETQRLKDRRLCLAAHRRARAQRHPPPPKKTKNAFLPYLLAMPSRRRTAAARSRFSCAATLLSTTGAPRLPPPPPVAYSM